MKATPVLTGRWPANVILSPEAAEVLDAQAPNTGKNGHNGIPERTPYEGEIFNGVTRREVQAQATDKGGASRFFLTAGYEPWELEWIIANGLTPCGLGEVEG